MAEKPLFTVAIPTYNGAKYVGQAVASILSQENVIFDLVVSDDRSEDCTLEVVRQLAGDRARLVVNSDRLGLAGNWNRCVELARTPYVAIIHQDDTIERYHLSHHLAAFGPVTGLVASNARPMDKAGRPLSPDQVEPGGCGLEDRRFPARTFVRELAIGNPLRCSAVSIRCAAHAAVGGFDSRLGYAVDWDFWIKVAERYEVAWIGATTVAFRWHLESETHRFNGGTKDLDEMAQLVSTLHSRTPSLRDLRPQSEQRLARAYLHRAYQAAKGGRSDLVLACLAHARSHDPRIILKIARDPRLAARLGWALLARGGGGD